MARGFRPVDRDAGFLLPPDMRDWLPQGHLVWTVLDAVDALDLSALTGSYRLGGRGRRAWDPAMMLALLIYAYAVGESSSRRIEARCGHDVAFRVIAAGDAPDHSSIAGFRARHRDAFTGLFAQVLRLCREAGLVKVGTIALDGTKMSTNASAGANRTAAGIETALAGESGEAVGDAQLVAERVRAAEVTDAARPRGSGRGIAGGGSGGRVRAGPGSASSRPGAEFGGSFRIPVTVACGPGRSVLVGHGAEPSS